MSKIELEKWVKEKQLILDQLLAENSPEYVHTRQMLTREYEQKRRKIEKEKTQLDKWLAHE